MGATEHKNKPMVVDADPMTLLSFREQKMVGFEPMCLLSVFALFGPLFERDMDCQAIEFRLQQMGLENWNELFQIGGTGESAIEMPCKCSACLMRIIPSIRRGYEYKGASTRSLNLNLDSSKK
jgi:hypothetical protein